MPEAMTAAVAASNPSIAAGDGVTDLCDITSGAADADEDGILDPRAVCPADVTHDDRVDIWDLLCYLDYWSAQHMLTERSGDPIPRTNDIGDWLTDCAGKM